MPRIEFKPEDYAWLGLGDVNKLIPTLKNPYREIIEKNPDEEFYRNFLRLHRNPVYFASLCKHIFNINIHPDHDVVLQELWNHSFPMLIASRGWGKSFYLALYCMIRCLLIPNTSIVIAGAGFRQAKLVFEYVERIWKQSPVFQSLLDGDSGPNKQADRWTFHINGSKIIAIPIGVGDKIRGIRANTVICDEFDAINPDVYQTVLQGFTAVNPDPMINVVLEGKKKYLVDNGLADERFLDFLSKGRENQSIISGTAGYEFKHFAKYWKNYKNIIESMGERKALDEFIEDEDIKNKTDYRDFSIIRIPFEIIPKGFMSDKTIARAKATTHSGIYLMEYGACFVKDSQGFFKRSLIEQCVTDEKRPINTPNGDSVWFDAKTLGAPRCRYVMGVDPASEHDNFTIIILEVYKDHSRIVYCWSTTRKRFLKDKTAEDNDFYSYCCRKIRNLMNTFKCERVCIDSQGGGRAIEQGLHDRSRLKDNDIPYWEIIDKEEPKSSDKEAGLHIIEMVNFADAEYTSSANHGVRKAMESYALLFPRYDNLSLGLAAEIDVQRFGDKAGEEMEVDGSLEGCLYEIEELKNELSLIVQTQTPTGRDKWDTPEILEAGKKSRVRKDRYSALIMAWMGAEAIQIKTPNRELVKGANAREQKKPKGKYGGILDSFVVIKRNGV